MQNLFSLIDRVASGQRNRVIQGETGTMAKNWSPSDSRQQFPEPTKPMVTAPTVRGR